MASIRSHGRADSSAVSPFEPLAAGRLGLEPAGPSARVAVADAASGGAPGAGTGRMPDHAPAFVPALVHGGCSDAGPVRPHNEDRWQASPGDGLYVVADGMGGYRAGEIAAEVAVATACRLLPGFLEQDDAAAAMQRAFDACNREIRERAAGNPDCLGMGTTLVACLVRGSALYVAHIGDSRAYRMRDGQLHRLTRDHSIGQQVADSGMLTEAQVRQLPGRGILTRALGVEQSVACDCAVFDWMPTDQLLLCSDGLSDRVADEAIGRLLLESGAAGPLAQAEALVAEALRAGGCDNITALVVRAAAHGPQDFLAGFQEAMH